MRLSLRGAHPVEWIALHAGLVPAPAAEAWGGMALSGTLITAVRTGMIARLAQGPASAEQVAADLSLDPVPARLLLECVRSAGYAQERAGHYGLTRSGRRWLGPGSALSVAAFVAGTADYWDWWASLDSVVREGRPVGHHDAPAGDPYWRRYVHGQFELARLSAGEVARKLPLPSGARSVLDVGGGHGSYSAELCRRHPGLSATVLDLPGSLAIGREIIAAAGLSDRVRHVEGDARTASLGDSHDAVLCFNLVHHLTPAEIIAVFRKAHEVIAPGGVLAIMDAFADPSRRQSAQASVLGLFTYLSSGSRVYTQAELRGWLREAGFTGRLRKVRVLRIPGQALYVALK